MMFRVRLGLAAPGIKVVWIITWAGNPKSHLCIAGRKFRIPVIMNIKLQESDAIPEDTPLLIDCTDGVGHVYIKVQEGLNQEIEFYPKYLVGFYGNHDILVTERSRKEQFSIGANSCRSIALRH